MDTFRKLMWLVKDRKGIAILYIALILVVLIAFVGLAVDIGYMYVAKGQLQNAADAAALAGASRLNGTAFANQSGARLEAWRLAYKNKMVPTGKSVFLVASSSYSTISSDVSLGTIDLNSSNDANGDIVLGQWTQSGGFVPAGPTSTSTVNAVKVVARATPSSPNHAVSLFFAKVLGFSEMGTSGTAIAAVIPLKLEPIIVNEYWLATAHGQRPYGGQQDYPNSFVRITNVDGNTSKVFRKIFAIIGADANDNVPSSVAKGSRSLNGYVDLDARTTTHNGLGSTWYSVNTSYTGATTCSNCPLGFSAPGAWDPNTGDINSTKGADSLGYLLSGYPSNTYYPDAVTERYISTYPDTTANYTCNSECPFATLAYFNTSGKDPLNLKDSGGNTFVTKFPVGTRILVMVYDGTFQPYKDNSQPNPVTVVGYTVVQIDGYGSSIDKLGTAGNTAYGHAVTDIVEPSLDYCGLCNSSFFDRINQLAIIYGNVKLVQ